jgi:hypothetical protein
MSWEPFSDATWEVWRRRLAWEFTPYRNHLREGAWVTCSADGIVGHGEIAPLLGAPIDCDVTRPWSRLPPHCQWGLEMAAVDWMARAQKKFPSEVLVERPLRCVERHALGFKRGYRWLKIKVAGEPNVEELRSYGARLRLDANRRWSVEEARLWGQMCRDLPIDYVEEPMENPAQCPFPVALDESLRGGHMPLPMDNVVAYAVKPAWYGGWGSLLKLAQLARENGIRLVISSAWESSQGWRSLVAAALALHAPDEPAGLDATPGLEGDFGEGPILESSHVFADHR